MHHPAKMTQLGAALVRRGGVRSSRPGDRDRRTNSAELWPPERSRIAPTRNYVRRVTAATCVSPPERGRRCALARLVGGSRPLNLGACRVFDVELEPGG